MNLARGLPQWGADRSADGERLYPAVDEPAGFVHVPATLEIATADSGAPDLSVAAVRGQNPFLPPAPYGVLDLRVRAGEISAAVLAAARAQRAAAVVTPAVFEGGFLRLEFGGGGTLDPAMLAELQEPWPLASNGLDAGRIVRRLSLEAVLLLRDVLAASGLTFTAIAEMSLRGLAERVAVTISFAPQALAAALTARADADLRIARDEIVAIWTEDGAVPLLRADGVDAIERPRLAEILTDWTVVSCAAPVAAPAEAIAGTVRLAPEAIGTEPVIWDLSRGRTALRTVILRLDPFAAAVRFAAENGLDSVWRETVVPPLQTGFVTIDVDTNLPAAIAGVERAGVELRAAPHPPDRVQALTGAVLFDEAPGTIAWRLSPREELRYEYTTFTMLRRDGAVRRVAGPATTTADRHLLVGAADLPVDLVAIEAGGGLLREGVVRGRLGPAPAATGTDFELTAERPAAAVALLPGEAELSALALEAVPLGEGASVTLGPLPARSLRVDLPSFPQFGPQTVSITVAFDLGVPLVALELRSERDELAGGAPTVLSLTPARPAREWHYLADSPFRAGYRWRPSGRADAGWSDLMAAGAPLELAASALGAAIPNGGPPVSGPPAAVTLPAEFVVDGVACYPAGAPDSFLVVPTGAVPEVDPAGRPTVMLVPAGTSAVLQLGVRLGPRDEALERLRVAIAEHQGIADPRLVRLAIAPLEIDGVTLAIDSGGGTLGEVARHDTSGFPPFNAIFAAPLDADQKRAVDAALAGEPGRAVVSYAARVERPTAAGLSWQPLAASTDLATWLAPEREAER